jgi:hypothetical protein
LRELHTASFLLGAAASAGTVVITIVLSVVAAAIVHLHDWQPGALLAALVVAAGLLVLAGVSAAALGRRS